MCVIAGIAILFIVLDVALGMRMNGNLITAIQILPVSALSALCYLRVVSLSRK